MSLFRNHKKKKKKTLRTTMFETRTLYNISNWKFEVGTNYLYTRLISIIFVRVLFLRVHCFSVFQQYLGYFTVFNIYLKNLNVSI
jgi:hypothetical protein